jgi:uncharacterized C2H2 Zn-finger protein
MKKCKSISGKHKWTKEVIFDRDGNRTNKCPLCGATRKAKP